MRLLSHNYRVVIAALALAATSFAQSIQTTWQQQVFNAQTTNGCSAVVRNINQASHSLLYCVSAPGGAGTVYLQGSNDGTNYSTISNLGSLSEADLSGGNCATIQAGQYYSDVQACIHNIAGGISVNAWYSASTGANPSPGNAGFASTDYPVTFVPVQQVVTSAGVSSTPTLFFNPSGQVLYGATLSNPNSGLVYVYVSSTNNPLTAGTTVIQAVPANGTATLALPPQGIYFGAGVYFTCSTSASSLVNPSTPCVASAYAKSINVGPVPN